MALQHTKRTTVYINEELHHALRIKAVETKHSVSELINDAVRTSLCEDSIDIEAYNKRKSEPTISFEKVLHDLKRNGKI